MSESNHPMILDIERRFDAPREAVFAALTEPKKMAQWFFGIPQGRAEVTQFFRVGGAYELKMFGPDGSKGCGNATEARHAPHGEYLETDAPGKLVFTWVSEGFVDSSTVTVLLEEDGSGTKRTLRHELPASVEPHQEGWGARLSNLETYLK